VALPQTARIERSDSQRRRTAASWLAAADGAMLGLFAHPDDEIFAAGLLAHAAASGTSVSVATATRGERGCAQDDPSCRGEALAVRRTEELFHSCRALGLPPPRLLDFADGELASAACAPPIAELFAELSPDVVVTLGRDGVYGHADHVALTHAVGIAIALARRPSPRLRVLHTLFPRGLFAPLRRALQRGNAVPLVPPAPLGGDVTRADITLELDPALVARKRSAIAAHVSQLRGDDPMTFLGRDLAGVLLTNEWYALDAGPPLP
jgi:LmbE family N-acetylglucosaminyl deacetylase